MSSSGPGIRFVQCLKKKDSKISGSRVWAHAVSLEKHGGVLHKAIILVSALGSSMVRRDGKVFKHEARGTEVRSTWMVTHFQASNYPWSYLCYCNSGGP
jgi:hypothetical protein